MKSISIVLIFLLFSIQLHSQTLRGVYSVSPLHGVGDDTELSETAKKPMIYGYTFSKNTSLCELISSEKNTIDTTYSVHYGRKFQGTRTTERPNKVEFYKDFEKNEYILIFEQNNNEVIIMDIIPKYSWNLSEETQSIAGYKCKKATTSIIKVGRRQNITAWYCEDLPINDGPSNFNGLPGLILQLEIDDLTLMKFEKIKILTDEDITINRPSSVSKPMTMTEYENKIMSKKY